MKLFNSIDCPLGVSSYIPQRKEWVQFALAGASLASSLLGGSAASRAAREAEKRQRQEEARENAAYTRRYNEDYIDTAAGQNLVRRAKQAYDRNIKRAEGAKAVAGGTDASVQMAKDSANQAMGDTIANIAAQDTARKAQADAMHEAAQQRFTQMDMNREMNRAQSIQNAAQGASNALMSAAGAVEQMNAAKVNLNGASNNGTDINQAVTQAQIDSASKVGMQRIADNTEYDWNGLVKKMG